MECHCKVVMMVISSLLMSVNYKSKKYFSEAHVNIISIVKVRILNDIN